MLSVGNKVFLPNYGAGVIDRIEEKKINDEIRVYIGISLLLDSMYLFIPSTKLVDYKIREVLDINNLVDCLNIIKDKPIKIEKKWTKRYRGNNEKISSGDFKKFCEVLRDLYYLKINGLLPPGEQKILDKTEKMVESEMSLVFNINMEEAKRKLEAFSK